MEIFQESGVQVVKVGNHEPQTLVLHPLGHTPESMIEHLQRIANSGRTVYAPNLFDIAESVQISGNQINFATLASKIDSLTFLDTSTQHSLAAYSLGGGVAWHLAAFKQSVDQIVAASPVGWPQQRNWPHWAYQLAKMMYEISQLPPNVRGIAGKGNIGFYKELLRRPNVALSLLKIGAHADLRELIPIVQSKVELLWGRRDRFVDVSHSRKLASLFPNAHLHIDSPYNHGWFDINLDLVPQYLAGNCKKDSQ